MAELVKAKIGVPERTLYRWIAEDRLTVQYRAGRPGCGRVAMLDPLEVSELAERLGRVDGR